MPDWSRRALLAATGVAGLGSLAGCTALDSLGDDRKLSYGLTVEDEGESLADTVSLEPDGDRAPWSAEDRRLYDAVVDGERYTTTGYDLVADEEYAEADGTYHKLQSVTTGVETIERSVLRLAWVGRRDELDDPPEAIERDALPPLDARAVYPAYVAARAQQYGGGAPWDIVEEGGYVYRFLGDAESELAPDPQHDYVAVDDTILAVSVTQDTLEEPIHTAVAIEIADSERGFERALDGAMVDARISEPLPEPQQRIVDRARVETYEETTPLSGQFSSLLRALGRHDLLDVDPGDAQPGGTNGLYLKYDSQFYRFGVYVNTVE